MVRQIPVRLAGVVEPALGYRPRLVLDWRAEVVLRRRFAVTLSDASEPVAADGHRLDLRDRLHEQAPGLVARAEIGMLRQEFSELIDPRSMLGDRPVHRRAELHFTRRSHKDFPHFADAVTASVTTRVLDQPLANPVR